MLSARPIAPRLFGRLGAMGHYIAHRNGTGRDQRIVAIEQRLALPDPGDLR
jgi:hypothetical protein